MRNVRFLSKALSLISLLAFLLCLFFGWLFYEFYFKWASLFDDGRYFDPETGVVFQDSSFVWGVLSLATLLSSIALWLIARKIKAKPQGVVEEASI